MSAAADPYKYFRLEAREILEGIGRGVLEIERAPAPATANQLLRLAHTLKGAARVVKQRAIAERAHEIEELLAPLRTPDALLEPESIERLLGLLDAIAAGVKTLDPTTPEVAKQTTEALRTVRADLRELDTLIEGASEASILVRSLRNDAASIRHARQLADRLFDQTDVGRFRDTTGAAATRTTAGDLRATLANVELSVTSALDQVERELADIRTLAGRLRLVPVSSLFVSLERTARDAAQALEKRVTLEWGGGDLRLDEQLLASVQAALVQLVRNAVAHGIEPVATRASRGKPPVGRVGIEIVRAGGRVLFTCADDGAGFDLEAIKAAAKKRGLEAAALERMDESELVGLLFRGGLTTSGEVTEVAGRGIGLDLVRDAVSRLGGDIHVDNKPGVGARVELAVPISLSAIDALLVEASDVIAAFPLEAVRRTFSVADADVARTATCQTIVCDGQAMPLLTLGTVLRATATTPRRRRAAGPAVVVEAGGALAAVRVDRLIGTTNMVVRSLPRAARADATVVGAGLDAEGNPQLVLDTARLVALALRPESTLPVTESERRAPILVIDDSLTTRRLEQSILESAGYEVDTATSGEDGLEKARARRYGLFLVDVEMPGMDGFTFIEQAQSDPALRDVPAILVTSRSSPEDRRRGEQVGARAHIAKGEFDQVRLLQTIERLRKS